MGIDVLKQVQQLWQRLTNRQRMVIGGGTLLTLITLAAMMKFFAAPEYKPFMTGLEPADTQSISGTLAAKKIAFQLTSDGKGINVAADQLDAARMEIATEGSPHSGRMGFELFDKSSWGQTEFDEKVNYQRAMEGELERTIQTLSGVKSARVHLVMPTSSVFLDRERGAKASVTLRMKHGALTPDQLNAISRLVSGAVDDLSPHDVAIIDADSNESLGNKDGTMEGRELEAELSKRLLATLGPALGAENLRTSVNVEYDMSSSEESQDKYDPAVSALLTSQKTSEQVGAGAGAGGVAGTASNLPNAAASANNTQPEDGAQNSSSENATYGVNKLIRHTTSPAGRIHRLTAAILVNDAVERKQVKGKWVSITHKRTPQQLTQIADLAKGILGADTARGDTVTVQNMPFDDTDAADTPTTMLEKVQNGMKQFATPLRYAAMLMLFLLVWALMIRPVQKQVLASLKELPAPVVSQTAMLPGTTLAGSGLASNAAKAALENDAETVRLKRELTDLVQAEPASMTRTLQSWLREDHA